MFLFLHNAISPLIHILICPAFPQLPLCLVWGHRIPVCRSPRPSCPSSRSLFSVSGYHSKLFTNPVFPYLGLIFTKINLSLNTSLCPNRTFFGGKSFELGIYLIFVKTITTRGLYLYRTRVRLLFTLVTN